MLLVSLVRSTVSYRWCVQAVEELNGKDIGGRVLYVGRAQKKAERQAHLRSNFDGLKLGERNLGGVNLYIKNLDDCVNDERLKEQFCEFGNVTSAKVDRFIGGGLR
jgi:polyadenylate-binding protein